LTDLALDGWSLQEQKDWKSDSGLEHDQFPEAIGIVDGMYLQINRPKSKEAAAYYSQYKKYHAVLFIVVVDRAGRIRMISDATRPGFTSETSTFLTMRFPLLHGVSLVRSIPSFAHFFVVLDL
jgi:hypothetical protein